MTILSGWGRYPKAESELVRVRGFEAARRQLARGSGAIARGSGRAYGDAAIGAVRTLDMTGFDRMRSFDPETGLLVAEAGILLADIIATFLPRGFFPAVVPGTWFVTLGGAIAADVHGKNHHRDGGFSENVESLVLVTPTGAARRVSRAADADLFAATIGGMGLTGLIVEATLKLRRIETGWIRRRTIVAGNLDEAMAAFEANEASTYSVAWIDALAPGAARGRSLVFLGEHARLGELGEADARERFPKERSGRLSLPLNLPAFTLNRWGVSAFNALYFGAGRRKAGAATLVPATSFFFPLDRIGDWNRIYGSTGFVQHQCVLPPETAARALSDMLERVQARRGGTASFLAVLKKLGPGKGFLSFPMPGYTLALDFAVRPDLPPFLEELDRIVVDAGGRLYLAKDARQSRATFDAGYPGADRFREIRRTLDPEGRLRSRLSDRLGL